MDYLLSGSGEVNLSLQDMIECDMKTEFDEPLENGHLNSMRNGLDSPLGLDTDSLSPIDLHDRNGLDKYGGLSRDVDISLSKDTKPDQSWLQSASLSTNVLQNDTASEVFQMVNPQTGLPVQLQTVSLAQVSQVSTRTTSPAHSTIQYVTASLPLTATTATPTIQRQLKSVTNSTTASNTQLHSLHNSKLITQALANGTAVTLSSVSYQQLLLQQQQQQQQSPRTTSLVTQQLLNSNNNQLKQVNKVDSEKVYPKPVYSYSCLIAMALKNSETGALPVSEIYSFMTENFPYFKTAPDGWKNSVRHNLSLNKCFEKIENPKATGSTRKGCLWGLNPAKIGKMDEEIAKWRKKDLEAIQRSMAKPEVLEKLEKGNLSSHTRRHLLNNLISEEHDVGLDSPTSGNNNFVSIAAAAPTLTSKPITGDIQLSMIEIKPAENGIGHLPVKVKVEPIFTIRPESVDASGAVGCSLTAEDLSVLDSSLSLDPSLGDSGLQNSVWEELGAEGISIDDIPFLFGPSTSSSSSVQTAKTGSSSSGGKSPMVSLLNANNIANGASGSHTVVTSSGLSHRLYAQT